MNNKSTDLMKRLATYKTNFEVDEIADTSWADYTPDDTTSYQLGLHAERSISSQVIYITRAEFISLKQHLASLRGGPRGLTA